MELYKNVRTIGTAAVLSVTLLAACGQQQPYDEFASAKANLAWQQQQQSTQLEMQQQAAIAPFEMAMKMAMLLTLTLAPLALLGAGIDSYRRRVRLVMPNSHGVLPLPRAVIEQQPAYAAAALGAFHTTELARATPAAHMFLPPSAPALLEKSAISNEAEALPAGTVDLTSLLGDWRPSLQSILLAVGPNNVRYTVHAKDLVNCAVAGATGGGKSNIMRLVLSQLQAAGAKVLLADPHFAPLDADTGDDWRPIEKRLFQPAAVKATDIGSMLEWLATDELPTRLERRRNGQSAGQPLFLALEELPAIVADCKAAPEHMARLLREGRKANLFIVGAAQDFLAKTLGGSGAVRDCYRTAYYVGGDTTSARVLLDITGRVDDGSLGAGLAMLRSKATPNAQLVRVPLASNNAVYELLGPAQRDVIDLAPMSAVAPPVTLGTLEMLQPVDTAYSASETAETLETLQPQPPEIAEIVKRLAASGVSQNKILEAVYNVRAGGSSAYQQAREAYRQAVANEA